MSKGKERVIDVDNKLSFLPNMLKRPAFDPRIPLKSIGVTSVRDSPRKMSLETSTSYRESKSNNTNAGEISGSE